MTPTRLGTTSGNNLSNGFMECALPAAAEGDIILLSVCSAHTLNTTPAGWTRIYTGRLYAPGASSTNRSGAFFWKRVAAGDPTSVTVVLGGSAPTSYAAVAVRGSVDPVIGPVQIRPSFNDTFIDAPPMSAPDESLVISMFNEATAASETAAQIAVVGATRFLAYVPTGSGHINDIVMTERAYVAGGTTENVRATWPSASVNAQGVQVALPSPSAPVAPGLPVRLQGESLVEGRMQISTGSDLVTPTAVRVVPPGYETVDAMLAQDPFFWAHRGGSRDFPEMSMYAYAQSGSILGYGALEVSLGRTSDGVWFGVHDSSLDRTSLGTGGGVGTQLVAAEMTWAEVQEYSIRGQNATNDPGQPARPYERLLDIIEKTPTSVIIVDPKASVSYAAELFELLLPYGGPDRFIGKYYGKDYRTPNAGRPLGYRSWGYFYDTVATGGDQQDENVIDNWHERWEFLGLNWDASASAWAKFTSLGKPVVAHIVPDAAAGAVALGRGAAGLQTAGVKSVAGALDVRFR